GAGTGARAGVLAGAAAAGAGGVARVGRRDVLLALLGLLVLGVEQGLTLGLGLALSLGGRVGLRLAGGGGAAGGLGRAVHLGLADVGQLLGDARCLGLRGGRRGLLVDGHVRGVAQRRLGRAGLVAGGLDLGLELGALTGVEHQPHQLLAVLGEGGVEL